MKIALVGSSRLDMSKAAGPLLKEMSKLPEGTVVLLRRPAHRSEEMGMFEQVASQLCTAFGFEVEWCIPDINEYEGRAATFERDIRMAERGDRVIAFFPAGGVMSHGSGHVVEKFHDVDKPSECFEVDGEGAYQWVGGMEAAV